MNKSSNASGPEFTSRSMCDACLLLIKGFQEEQNPFGKGISGSYRSHFSTGGVFASCGAPTRRVFTQRSVSHGGQGWGSGGSQRALGIWGTLQLYYGYPRTFLLWNDPHNFLWGISFPPLSFFRVHTNTCSTLEVTVIGSGVGTWPPRTNGRKDTFAENSGIKISALISLCVKPGACGPELWAVCNYGKSEKKRAERLSKTGPADKSLSSR